VIIGVHAIIFAHDASRVREFFRDVLELESVDAGGGWLIFAMPPTELAAHPTDGPPHHRLYLMCDDIRATVTELAGKGVEFLGKITEQGFGLMTTMVVPGGGELVIYEPKHPSPPAPRT